MSKYSSRARTGFLGDGSWIKRADDEDEDIDRDPNFAKTVLSHAPPGSASSTSTTVSKDGKTTTTTETTTIRSGVKQSSRTETFTQRVLSSSKEPQYSSYTPKTTEVARRSVTSTKDAEDHLFDTLVQSPTRKNYSPTDSKTSVITSETVTSKTSGDAHAEDQLYDRLIPKSIKDEASSGRKSVSSVETISVRSTSIGADDDFDSYRTKSLSSDRTSSLTRGESPTMSSKTSIRNYSSYTEESPVTTTTSYTISSSKSSDDYNSDLKNYSYSSRPNSSYEYTSVTSPSSYSTSTTTYRSSSRSDDSLSDPIYSNSSIKKSYTSSERAVLEKDLCTTCRKPFTGDAKMVLDDMNINCHATCFKCDVCNSTLGNLKAGDSMWVYRGMVHCENCFEVTKAKWQR
ncbi:sciellin isoform X1 [Gouania willdenowi]|uniref:LIM zinc-binding domain-containing protein n=1 Tax=Gouania willdenowi TaxID=441366 RepID=A0A8C5EI25_GOUWI|nr:sciellin isoform X1 [Gouania willdenowi]